MPDVRSKNKAFWIIPVLAAALAAVGWVGAAGQTPAPLPEFTATEAMVPMRDGVKLHTVVFAPKKAAGPLPFLLMRTPYGAPGSAAVPDGREPAGARR